MRTTATVAAVFWLASCLTLGGCQGDDDPASEFREVTPGLRAHDTVAGTGTTADEGDVVRVHYTGWLYEDGVRGEQFDSSVDRGEPFMLRLGYGMVIKGWDEGLKGMQVGGRRTLLIEPELAYGERGRPPSIPPQSTLMFEVELLDVLQVETVVLQNGSGPACARGDEVDVHYTGWLFEQGEKGAQFDSSHDRGQPLTFRLGAGRVILGWDLGVEGMQVGEKRLLTIAPDLAYGERAIQDGGKVIIPAGSTLVFEVELMAIRPGAASPNG
jgi:FKBP-type peptidyl-prolyl cis-trans isomerase